MDMTTTKTEVDNQKLFWDIQLNIDLVLQENLNLSQKLDLESLVVYVDYIQKSKRIFIASAGRSGLAMRAAAMRMMHLGFNVFLVGDVLTPAIASGDLLITASGSGTTGAIVRAAEKSVSAGASVVAITTNPKSPLAQLAQHVVIIPAAEKEDHHGGKSKQYSGSLFEQFLFLLMDAVFQSLWKLDGKPAEELWKRHANLE